jgi:hypothetical protein
MSTLRQNLLMREAELWTPAPSLRSTALQYSVGENAVDYRARPGYAKLTASLSVLNAKGSENNSTRLRKTAR